MRIKNLLKNKKLTSFKIKIEKMLESNGKIIDLLVLMPGIKKLTLNQARNGEVGLDVILKIKIIKK